VFEMKRVSHKSRLFLYTGTNKLVPRKPHLPGSPSPRLGCAPWVGCTAKVEGTGVASKDSDSDPGDHRDIFKWLRVGGRGIR
jgi:hypothetical protein